MNKQASATVAVNLRRIIKEKNLTQEKLAAKCGLSKGTISNYVNGKLGNEGPTETTLTLISNGLGIPMSDLLAEIKDPIVAETAVALTQANAQNEVLETKLEDTEAELADKEAELADKEAALAHSEEKLAAKEQTLEELSSHISQMKTELSESNARTADMFRFMRRSLTVIAAAFAVELIASSVAVALLVGWILNHV